MAGDQVTLINGQVILIKLAIAPEASLTVSTNRKHIVHRLVPLTQLHVLPQGVPCNVRKNRSHSAAHKQDIFEKVRTHRGYTQVDLQNRLLGATAERTEGPSRNNSRCPPP